MEGLEFVKKWLVERGFEKYCDVFEECEVDKESLLCLTERAAEHLVPVLGPRMKFLKELEKYKKEVSSNPSANTSSNTINLDINNNEIESRCSSSSDSVLEVICPPPNMPLPSTSASPPSPGPIFNAKRPWPAVIQLPKSYRPELASALQSKEAKNVTPRLRKLFNQRIFGYFSQYTLYSTKTQIQSVAQAIIRDYPFLKDKTVGSGYDSWVAQIYEKFRNERRRLTENPEVKMQKSKRAAAASSDTKSATLSKKVKRGDLNWEPPFPQGEDETTMNIHKQFLKDEFVKRSPDKGKIARRMLVTFPDRRKMVNEKRPIKEIKEEYPVLFCSSEIIADFERLLMVTSGVVESFTHNVRQVAADIIRLAREKTLFKSEMKKFLDLLETEPTEGVDEPSANELAEVALVLLPFLLPQKRSKANQEDFVRFVSEDEDVETFALKLASPSPVIVVKGALEGMLNSSIVADKQVLFEVEGGMMEATMALFATYYVFMYEYPASLNNFFTYLQKCIFQIPDARKLPTSVITFVNALDCSMEN